VDVVPLDVDVVEERLVHPAEVRMRIFPGHGVVFIEIERHNPRKIETFVLVKPDEFAIEPNGSAAGCQTKNGRLARGVPRAYELIEFPRHVFGRRRGSLKPNSRRARVRKRVQIGHDDSWRAPVFVELIRMPTDDVGLESRGYGCSSSYTIPGETSTNEEFPKSHRSGPFMRSGHSAIGKTGDEGFNA
jgi:hypothetical protein